MRLFLYEHITALSTTTAQASALYAEGWAMFQALREDFARVDSLEVLTMPETTDTEGEEAVFRRLAAGANYTLVIAPEFDGILQTRCRWAEEAGSRLLGPSPAAVGLCGDKLRLGRPLQQQGVPTPPCILLPGPGCTFPAVLKPRHGAGSQATFFIREAGELAACLERAQTEGWSSEMLLEPFAAGQAASVAFLLGSRSTTALVPAAQ